MNLLHIELDKSVRNICKNWMGIVVGEDLLHIDWGKTAEHICKIVWNS